MTSGGEPGARPGNGDLDTRVAYSARVNNYWHGGKDNFAKDREAAEQALEAFPELPVAVRARVRFRARVVTLLAREYGIRPEASTGMADRLNRLVAQKRTYRSQAEVSRFFDGLDYCHRASSRCRAGARPASWRPAHPPWPGRAWARSPEIPGTGDRTLHTVVYKLEK